MHGLSPFRSWATTTPSDVQRDARNRVAATIEIVRADLHGQHDQTAARVVGQGGASMAVLAGTDLRTLDNLARLIDPAIPTQAFVVR